MFASVYNGDKSHHFRFLSRTFDFVVSGFHSVMHWLCCGTDRQLPEKIEASKRISRGNDGRCDRCLNDSDFEQNKNAHGRDGGCHKDSLQRGFPFCPHNNVPYF